MRQTSAESLNKE